MDEKNALRPTQPSVPIGMIRSALFGVSPPKGPMVRDQVIHACDRLGTRLMYSGPLLGQQHALVWQAVIQASKAAGDQIFLASATSLLRAIGLGRADDTNARRRLFRLLKDLTLANVQLDSRSHSYVGSLLSGVALDKTTHQLELRLNPEMTQVLANEVLLNDLQRKASLGRNQLALWLHDFFASHKIPPATSLAEFKRITGSVLPLAQFRARIKKAMKLLEGGSSPLITKWWIDPQGRLHAEKTATRVVLLPNDRMVPAGARERASAHTAAVARARAQRASVAL